MLKTLYILISKVSATSRKKYRVTPDEKNERNNLSVTDDSYVSHRHVVQPTIQPNQRVAAIAPEPHPKIRISKAPELAEQEVEVALRGLNENRYFVFRDLIVPSHSKDLTLTQIDHVVVSKYGIYCIETKSHRGDIYGYSRSENWKQFLGGKNFTVHSPFRQNHHHVRALESLLRGQLNAPIHSYIAMPNARKVVVDGKIEDMSPSGVINKINKHTQVVYGPPALERIAKTLAHAATYRELLRDRHSEEVRSYVSAKVARTLKYS